MPNQPKKFRVLLKPLGDRNTRHELRRAKLRQDNEQYIANLTKKLEQETIGQPRVIDADAVKVIDNATMLIGIGPTSSRESYIKGFMGKRKPNGTPPLKRKKRDTEFYDLKWAPGHEGRPRYEGGRPRGPTGLYHIKQKFEKILSVNLDNVISVNGKPVIGGMRTIDKGMQHLDFNEDWSIDNIADLLGE